MKSHLRKDKLLKRIDKSLHDVTAIPVIYHPWGSCNAREAQKVGWHTHSFRFGYAKTCELHFNLAWARKTVQRKNLHLQVLYVTCIVLDTS